MVGGFDGEGKAVPPVCPDLKVERLFGFSVDKKGDLGSSGGQKTMMACRA